MFTGLVEIAGEILDFTPSESAYDLKVLAPEVAAECKLGDSIAVNGCCLTVTGIEKDRISFQLLEETIRCTGFSELSVGSRVNLERSLLPTTRMGGHFVSGHVDECALISVFEPRGNDHYLRVQCGEEGSKYLVSKGSVAVDGISLTVAEVHEDGFAVWLIPHTLSVTNLAQRKAGQKVNIEYDLLAKYVHRVQSKN